MVTYEELVEKLARDIEPVAWSYKDKPKDTFTRECVRLLSLAKATAAIATMHEALKEADTRMLGAGQAAWNADPLKRSSTLWTAMLAASPLVEGERG